MIHADDGQRYQSAINRVSLRHPFTTNPSRVALLPADFIHMSGVYYHLDTSKGSFIWEGGRNLQKFLVSTANNYNWITDAPFDPLTEIPPNRLSQLDLCEPPLFPLLFMVHNVLLLPGTRAQITRSVEYFQDRMMRMEV